MMAKNNTPLVFANAEMARLRDWTPEKALSTGRYESYGI